MRITRLSLKIKTNVEHRELPAESLACCLKDEPGFAWIIDSSQSDSHGIRDSDGHLMSFSTHKAKA